MMAEYDLKLKHLPGIKNRADALSRRPDYYKGEDNDQVTALPEKLFIRTMEFMALERQLTLDQVQRKDLIEQWKTKHNL